MIYKESKLKELPHKKLVKITMSFQEKADKLQRKIFALEYKDRSKNKLLKKIRNQLDCILENKIEKQFDDEIIDLSE